MGFCGGSAHVDVELLPPRRAVGRGPRVGLCLQLARGVLVKDTHGQTIRIAPPLVIRATELDWAVEQLRFVLDA